MVKMIEPRSLFGGLGNRMFQMAYIMAQEAKGEIPDIYIQDPSYFENVGNDVRLLYGMNVMPIDAVSLHIRRGDYTNNPYYVDLTKTDYYDKAIAQFPNAKFLVFCADRQNEDTDKSDRQWCDNYLASKGIDYSIWSSNSEVADFNAMAGCHSHIMANSSFSWWASYVGGGKVIAPTEWFTDGVERVGLLEEWIKI